MYYSTIGILAILILFIVNWDILHVSRTYEKAAWNVYRRFLFAVLIYYLVDVLWGIIEAQKLAVSLFVDTTIYFVAMAVGISFWAEFTVAYLNEKGSFGKTLVILGRIIATLIMVVTIINIFRPVLFAVDKDCVYIAFPVRYAVLICQIIFLLVISLYSTISMLQTESKGRIKIRYRTIILFGIIMALFLFIQLWFPYLPLYSIAYMLGTCMLHSFVVNDEIEDYERRLEETQRISEARNRFLTLLNNMPGVTFAKDAKTGKYIACNQAFAEYANKKTTEEVLGFTDVDLFDPETAKHFSETDKITLTLSRPYIYYEETMDALGNARHLQTMKTKYTDAADNVCILGMCQDMTDMLSVEYEQARTKEAYENAVNTGLMYTHIAQTLARDYTDMFYVNTDSEEFVEYQKGEGESTLSEIRRGWHFFSDCKKELSEGAYSEDREQFLHAINRKNLMKMLSRKDTYVFTYRRMIKGKPTYVSMKVSRMVNDERYIIIGFSNVDAQIRETMAQSKALSEALSSAEAANNAKTMLLSGMSHEIRTPINAIIGLGTLAQKKEKMDPETRDYFEKIGDSAEQLLSLIDDILNISRLESGRAVLNNNEFSLGTMLELINAQITQECADKGIKYECQMINSVHDSYIGDDMKLIEILKNILSNAIKFTEKSGSVMLSVEETASYGDQSTLCFKVKDTGIGMDKDFIPKIYDVFAQEDSVSGSKYSRRGLGMTITKRLVEMMSGSISVESEKGVGTEVTVMVTLQKCDKVETKYSAEIDTQAMYVLVVDDNPVEAEHAKLILEEVGIKADACTSGQEALSKMEMQRVRQQQYNIILMDWNMPGMNGRETAAEIMRLYDKECTIVAMTAYSWDDIQEEAKSVGVENFLGKPLYTANIIENLSQIAHRSKMSVFKEKKKARLAGRRVLLAEDVEINAEIMMDMLEMENIKVDHAENGKVAVELFENSTSGIYSAILMDVRMPEMDGLEATRLIRDMDREDAKRIPIIALTANSFDEDVKLSLQAGMNAHLTKPVELDYLIRILGELIYESEESILV